MFSNDIADPTFASRFWARFQPGPDGCLDWTGATIPRGYGSIGMRALGRQVGTHRVAWILTRGPIPDGMHVLHRCDRPVCGNPEHLFLGTNADNNADKVAKGRHAHGETHGNAVLTEAKVRTARAMRAQGLTNRQIATSLGVSFYAIKDACQGRTWGWLA